MLAPDDMEVGMFIAVTESWNLPRDCTVSGKPFEVLAVNLPFLACREGAMRFIIDVRDHKFIRASKQYVDALHVSKPTATADYRSCPRCGEMRNERMTAGDKTWKLACPNCELETEVAK